MELAYFAFIVLGILFGIAFIADFWGLRKGKVSSKIAGATNILVGIIPLISSKIGYELPMSLSWVFFIAFGATSITVLITVTAYCQKKILAKSQYLNITFTWIDVLFHGYAEVKNRIDLQIEENQKSIDNKANAILSHAPDAIAEFLPKFIFDLFVSIPKEITETEIPETEFSIADRFITGATWMLQCIHGIIPQTYSRFSLRAYDKDLDQMICISCTQPEENKYPSPIIMPKTNMIMRSIEIGKTAIYSENKNYHQDTNEHTIIRSDKRYDDYITQAIGVHEINEKERRSLFSVNMDVWAEYIPLLRLLAKLGIFKTFGKAIENLYNSDIFINKKDLLFKQLIDKSKKTIEKVKNGQ